MQQPFKARTLTITHNVPEDRLVLLAIGAEGEKFALLLTRRLTGRLINGFAGILEKSSLTVSRAPAEMRDDVVLLEHQEALGGSTPHGDAAASGPAPGQPGGSETRSQSVQVPSALLTAVDVATKPTHFEFTLKSGDRFITGFNMNRNELHRTLDLLKNKAQEADWNLRLDASWLGADQSMMVIN